MSANKYLEVLTPQNSQIIFIDQQPQMAFGCLLYTSRCV